MAGASPVAILEMLGLVSLTCCQCCLLLMLRAARKGSVGVYQALVQLQAAVARLRHRRSLWQTCMLGRCLLPQLLAACYCLPGGDFYGS